MTHSFSLHEIAHALPNGRVISGGVSFAAPGHSHKDDSGRVLINDRMPFGIWVQSLAQDDELDLRDFVLGRLGVGPDDWREQREPDPEFARHRQEARDRADRERLSEIQRRRRRAREIWTNALNPHGTIVETYLRSRALDLGDDLAGSVIRFHPACPWRDQAADRTVTVPAMVCAMRNIATGEIHAIHRTRLTDDGRKVDRRMLGPTASAAVMLDAFETITSGLAVGEGVETSMSARQLGIRPTWAMGSIGAIADLPPLAGVESLTLLGENDATGASDAGCRKAGNRWAAAGRAVDVIRPDRGKDLNDELMGRAEA